MLALKISIPYQVVVKSSRATRNATKVLETYSASVNHEVLQSYESLFLLTFSIYKETLDHCQIISHPTT